jgi:hypothetical protein
MAGLLLLLVRFAWGEGPVLEGPEGKRAFDDLGAIYDDRGGPDLPQMWERLHATDAATRASAGRYLLALCQQSLDDETTGRSSLSKNLPGFGRGPDVIAREFRKELAGDLVNHAAMREAVPALEWLLQNDILSETRKQALETLCLINSPEADKVLLALLAQPHPEGAIVARALEEARRRNLRDAAEYLPALSVHFRGDVRKAARAVAEAWGIGNLPTFNPEEAVVHFDGALRDINSMVYPAIPGNARFLKFTEKFPARGNFREYVRTGWAWLIREDADSYYVIDSFGSEENLSKTQTTIAYAKLAEWGQSLMELRAAEGRDQKSADAIMGLSPYGGLSGQFEPEVLRLPEILVAAWSYVRGDRVMTAAVLLPRMEALDDERWLREIGRDMIGHQYDEAMLTELVDKRDYPAALSYAKHLSSPLFRDFEFQDRAQKLLQELPSRMNEDFVTFTLPTPGQWERMRRDMTRAQQIRFLADRLRLVNVRQLGWPADVQFCDPQRSVPLGGTIYSRVDYSRGEAVINPMRELTLMQLEPADMEALLPYLTHEEYVLAYYVWRPWHPSWHLFQVNELVTDLANDAAGTRLVKLQDYYGRPPAERAGYIVELQKRAAAIHPRWFRALGDLRAIWDHRIDLSVGVATLILGGVWLALRRKARGKAILGGVVLGLGGLITIWFPALQAQRTMLWADRIPIAIVTIAAVSWSSRLVPKRRGYVALGIGLSIATALICGFFGFWGWQTDTQSVVIASLLAWIVIGTPGWRKRILAAGAMILVVLAFAAPGTVVACAQAHGWTPPPDFEARVDVFHPILAGMIGLGCVALLQLGWQIQSRQAS